MVLRYAYQFSQNEISNAFKQLFGLSHVHLSHPVLMTKVIEWHQQGMDFADALHLSQSQQCHELYTCDKKFASKAKD